MSIEKPATDPGPEVAVNIGMAIVLTIVTCGIYGLVWRYKQMNAINQFLGRDEFNFGL